MDTLQTPASEQVAPAHLDAPVTAADPPTAAPRASALRFAGPIVALVLSIKVLLYLLGPIVRGAVNNEQLPTFSLRMESWYRWDSSNYVSIAEHGYQSVGRAANYIAFFPGYPLAVRILHELLPLGMVASAFVVSAIGSVTAAVLLGYLVRHDTGDDARAHRAVWFFLIFPTAYFLHVPYTESLFISLVLGAFLAARTGHWATAGIVGALAAFTRVNGLLLVPALAVEAYLQYRQDGKVRRSWLWIAFAATGFLAYLAINQHVYGSPLHFQEVLDKTWQKHFQDPVKSISGMVNGLGAWDARMRPLMQAELVFLAIGLVGAIAAFIWTRASYGVWALLNVVLFASTSWIQSTPRYVLTLFPMFLLLAAVATRHRWLGWIVSAWSLTFMAVFATLYALGGWAF